MLRNMFKKTYTRIDAKYKPQEGNEGAEPNIPEGLWRKCNKCGQPIYVEDVVNNYYVCPKCSGYFRVHEMCIRDRRRAGDTKNLLPFLL